MPQTPPETSELVISFATALGLGLLVGLQREWVHNRVAGIRTFALLTLLGALSGLLGIYFGGWVIAASLLAFAGMVVLGNLAEQKRNALDSGLTTEMAMLVMFSAGIITVMGQQIIAMMIAGSVMVLLQSKKTLHGMVHKIGENDLREVGRLVLVGLVILPALPNREMGFFNVLNPFSIWLMVVLIVGISLAAYLAGKFLGGGKGPFVAGLIGGLITSTATTMALARRSRNPAARGISLAAITLIASSVVFIRVILEIAMVAPSHFLKMLPPLLVMLLWFAGVAIVVHFLSRKSAASSEDEQPPSGLGSAILFGLLYAFVLLAVAAARSHFGTAGLYVASVISGLTDMDAITLSTANLVNTAHLDTNTAWRMILLAGLANLFFKMVLAAILGARAFVIPVLLGLGSALLGGTAIFLLWP